MILAEEASLEELPPLAQKVKKLLQAPCVIALTGEMGAGKTTFVQSFANHSTQPTSPSYSLINKMGDIAHADLYRIESEDELNYLEISLYRECQYIFIEWGRRMLSVISGELGPEFLYYELEIREKTQKKGKREYILSQC